MHTHMIVNNLMFSHLSMSQLVFFKLYDCDCAVLERCGADGNGSEGRVLPRPF